MKWPHFRIAFPCPPAPPFWGWPGRSFPLCAPISGAFAYRKIRRHPERGGLDFALFGVLLAAINLVAAVAVPGWAAKLNGM